MQIAKILLSNHEGERKMDVYKITGENRLQGTIKVSGAKNSAVALIPASILANSPVTIGGIPEISDAWTLKAL